MFVLFLPLIEQDRERSHSMSDYSIENEKTSKEKKKEMSNWSINYYHQTLVNVINNPRILVMTMIPINRKETYCDQNLTSNCKLK